MSEIEVKFLSLGLVLTNHMKTTNMNDPWDVVVVGSCMIDLICYAPRLPKGGETLEGSDFSVGFGGKGCNQCVAAKKLGASAILIARVGDDSFGRDYLKHLQGLDIPIDYVRETKDVTSGMAQITVADNGENQIVIVPGANKVVCEEDLVAAEDTIKNCKVLMCQMEINPDCTKKAIEMKSKAGTGKIIFNGAPATSSLDLSTYLLSDIFCVNESEAETFSGIKVQNVEQGKKALLALIEKGFREVIITLGDQGALFGTQDGENITHIPTNKVTPVDTTGAGDAFIGALGYFMAKYPEMSREEMIVRACATASLSVERKGTQESFPSFSELKSKGIIT